jgi:hypothetical protein
MNKDIIRGQEKELKNKRKYDQSKVNFQLREMELKKELNLYKQHLEDGKKIWNDQMKIIRNSMKVSNITKHTIN